MKTKEFRKAMFEMLEKLGVVKKEMKKKEEFKEAVCKLLKEIEKNKDFIKKIGLEGRLLLIAAKEVRRLAK